MFQFILINENGSEEYVKMKISNLVRNGNRSLMLQIFNCTKDVLLQEQKSQNHILNMINATVSHELRNPLNSLIALNVERKFLYQQLKKVILSCNPNQKQTNDLLRITNKLDRGLETQESSAKIMSYLI